jgi:hypothetical protein
MDMAGNALVRDWRTKINAGTLLGPLLGPRYTVGSRIIDGSPTIWDPQILNVISVADADEARQAVAAAGMPDTEAAAAGCLCHR